MVDVIALDITLGPALRDAIARCLDAGEAFAVLNPQDSAARRADVLAALAPTFIQNHEGERFIYSNGTPVEPGDAALVVTSGTSGTPKVAIHTLAGLLASAHMTSAALRRTAHDQWFACLPAHHIGGLATIIRGIALGEPTHFGPAADPTAARRAGATHVSVVRTLVARHNYDDFDCVLLGGSTPPSLLPDNVVTTWGMTETGSGVVYDHLPLEGVAIAIDADGQVLVKSPTLLRAYRHDAHPLRDDGWFATGDAGSFSNGRLTIHGRMAYVINTGGEKVWPDDVERLMEPLLAQQAFAIVGRDDAEWGQRVVCISEQPIDRALQEQLRDIVRNRLGAPAVPKEFDVVERLPRTENGKIRRSDLR
jgi:O-succinylbenzoic acid--CoA ligase